MPAHLNGATRIHYIVGDPIAQVKSPADVTSALAALGHNAIVVPAQVAPAALPAWVAGVSLAQNVDSIIVTVPHKFAGHDLCASLSERAAFLHAVNVMRRNPDGSWHGDMFDGLGFVTALEEQGCQPAGKKTLLVGAGGAGSAIAHALVVAGVRELAICDADPTRRGALVERLAGLGLCPVRPGDSDPAGFELVVNATPMGMAPSDPYPVDVSKLQEGMFVGCVITAPAVSPFIAAARARGCDTMTGSQMFGRVRDLLVGFLVGR